MPIEENCYKTNKTAQYSQFGDVLRFNISRLISTHRSCPRNSHVQAWNMMRTRPQFRCGIRMLPMNLETCRSSSSAKDNAQAIKNLGSGKTSLWQPQQLLRNSQYCPSGTQLTHRTSNTATYRRFVWIWMLEHGCLNSIMLYKLRLANVRQGYYKGRVYAASFCVSLKSS